ncbi:RNA polymerase sigma factor [Streptomyces malaysiensis]|uniref:RNA polymerase sigma factor n=1 Tax=Streptomyces malaysiensis TaxID=92644 RepID=UPI0008536536|nr:sigma-70 family RNA polymerase sigma factor [Streptomyces sp. SPMA113]
MVSPAGDEWEALYRRYGRTVLHAATLAAGGSAYDGWDGVQHAFSQAWLYLTEPSRPPVHNWVGWLRKSAVRHVVQAAKSEARALPLLDRDQQQDGPLLENWVAVKEEYQGVLKAVAALPTRQRQALALCCIAGCSVREAALIMDVEDGTVRSLISQARQALPPRRGEETGDEQ